MSDSSYLDKNVKLDELTNTRANITDKNTNKFNTNINRQSLNSALSQNVTNEFNKVEKNNEAPNNNIQHPALTYTIGHVYSQRR